METGGELAIKQVELHPESGQNNIKVPVPPFPLIGRPMPSLLNSAFVIDWLQEVQALEVEISLFKHLQHEVCMCVCLLSSHRLAALLIWRPWPCYSGLYSTTALSAASSTSPFSWNTSLAYVTMHSTVHVLDDGVLISLLTWLWRSWWL